MYALKARDRLHKREKEELKERERSSHQRTRDSEAHHHRQQEQAGRRTPSTAKRDAKYIGTFSVEMKPSWKSDVGKAVKHQLSRVNVKDPSGCQLPVVVLVNMEGVKVLSNDGRELIMAHALKRILFCTVDTKKCLFAMVARNPDAGSDGVYSHVFQTSKKDQASELNDIVSKAFKANYARMSLKRDKKKGKKSPWNVKQASDHLSPPQPQSSKQNSKSPGSSPSSQHRLSDNFTPSAPSLPSQPPQVAHPHSSHSPQMPHPPPSTPSLSQLLDEASSLEGEIAQLQARNREIEGQMIELAAIEDAVVQLTSQLSANQKKVDDKKRRLFEIQQLIDASLGSGSSGASSHLQPLAGAPMPYAGSPAGFSGSGARTNDDPLPDFAAISLEDADWFQEGLPREIAMEILSHQPEGAFIVRNSTSNPGCFALSLKLQQGKIMHYLIENNSRGVKLQGSSNYFPNLVDLINHYSFVCDGSLPCTLNLSSTNPTFLEGVASSHHGNDSDEDDDDYLGLPQYHLIT